MQTTNVPGLNTSGHEGKPPEPPGNATAKIVVGVVVVLGVLVLVGAVAGVAVVIWRNRTRPNTKLTPITVTASDMSIIALTHSPEVRTRLATSEAARKDFAKNVRDLLAIAEEARLKGLADRPDLKREIALTRAVIISENYWKSEGAPSASTSDVEAVFKEPGQAERFNQFVKDAQAKHPERQLNDERSGDLKQQFGQALIGERRGVAAGIDKIRGVELQIMIEQARVLASTYGKETIAPNTKPTEPEIDAHIAKNQNLTHDQAREAVEQEKQKTAIDEIVKRQGAHIIVAEEFTVTAPPAISQPTSPSNTLRQ